MEQYLKGLPKVLKIGAYDWKVKLEDGENTRCGLTDFETSSIHLWPSNLTSPSHCVGIVLHECLHVIFDNEKLGKLKRGKEAREEQLVVGFECGLVALLRDNPRFLNWMIKWLKSVT